MLKGVFQNEMKNAARIKKAYENIKFSCKGKYILKHKNPKIL